MSKLKKNQPKKFKVYELDFGDTNLLAEDPQVHFDWIKCDIESMGENDALEYTITFRMMTRKEINEIPEWS